MGDRETVGAPYPISHLLSPVLKAALADGVREVWDLPDFLGRYGRVIGLFGVLRD